MKMIAALMLFASTCGVSAQTGMVITGKLLGHDGKPTQQADIHVVKVPGQRATSTVHPAGDGSFSLTVTDTGIVTVKFAGLFHLSQDVLFISEPQKTVGVDVRLGTYRYAKKLGDIRIMGTFNNWNMQNAVTMKNESDGTYSAEFDVKETDFGYEVIGLEMTGRSINGTQSEYFEYDGDGDYRSFIRPKDGKAKILLDPKKVVSSPAQPQLRFADPNSRTAKYALIQWDKGQRTRERTEAVRAFLDAGGVYSDFKYEKDMGAELEELAARIRAEKDDLLIQALLSSYLAVPEAKGDPEIVAMFLKRAPAIMRNLAGNRVYELLSPLTTAGDMMRFDETFKNSYADILEGVSDLNVKANVALNILSRVQSKNDPALMQGYYDVSLQKLAGNAVLPFIRDRFAPKKTLSVGSTVPMFTVKSLDDSMVVFTDKNFRGKWYLIDFWATWCGPCVAEMENMHKTYEKFRSRNFEILSLSLDVKQENIRKFRNAKWKMPWLHAFVTTDKRIQSDFSVVTIPKPVLVDANGKIAALQDDLRGPQLEKTLLKFLGDAK